MDGLELAFLQRARTALDAAIDSQKLSDQRAKARAFVEIAREMIAAQNTGDAVSRLKAHGDDLVQKAAAHALGDDIWDGGDAAGLAAAYLATISEQSILDQIRRYARVLGSGMRRVMIASDAVGDVVAEGDPKPVKRVNLSIDELTMTKAAAIVVMTKELARATNDEARSLFETELASAVNRATNASVLTSLTTSATVSVAGTGDPLSDLRAGLRAAAPSTGYVVAAPPSEVADLATRAENRGGMGIRGGTFVRGVEVVVMDNVNGMHIIPASRLAMFDEGLKLRSAGHATVDMRDTPDSPAQLVSLWQTNSIGLLVERSWHLAGDAELVIVGAESP